MREQIPEYDRESADTNNHHSASLLGHKLRGSIAYLDNAVDGISLG